MKPQYHIAASAAAAGALYWWTKSAAPAAGCLGGGILLDLDHVADFLVFSGEKFTVPDFLSWCNDVRWKKVTLLLHSYELFAVFAVWTLARAGAETNGGLFLHGALAGAGLHMLMDQFGHNLVPRKRDVSPWFYFLTYRLLHDFSREKLLKQ